jgi:TP901 family phage tail tape measure protein
VQANFDAAITLDIGPFIASISKAQSEVAKLSGQLDALNKKTVSPTVSVRSQSTPSPASTASSASPDAGVSVARKEMAKQEIAQQKQIDAARESSYRQESRRINEINKAHEAAHKENNQRIAVINKAHEAAHKENAQRTAVMNKAHQAAFAEDARRSQAMTKMHGAAIREDQQRTKAQATARQAQIQQNEKNLARERYALYDVAAAYTAIATAAAGAVFATAQTAINFERAFVDVERTTDFVSAKIGAAADSAKNDLKSLASEIPVAFGQITQIATIGNQLGIAQGALTSFTETVAKFSTTTGVSVEQTAMSFGRIGELLQVDAADFEKMGSAIAFAGVNAVATEAQILSVTKEIATTAKMAKFLTPDIIGLSTALSSLGIAPEAARGSIIRTFAGINKAVTEGGSVLEEYARIAGMPAQAFASTWSTDGEAAFGEFLKGLQGLADGGANLDSVLRNLGMVNVRDIQTIQKLGDNYDVYASSLRDANQGFDEGTFLAESYGKVQETVASKLILVQNNIANLLDTIGQSAVGDSFKALLDIVNDALVRLNQFAKTPIGQAFSGMAVGLTAIIAVFAAVNAISALAQASLRAFATAQSALVASSAQATGAIAGMNTQLGATAVAGNLASLGIDKGKVAAVAFGNFLKTIKWTAIILAVVAAIQQMGIAFSSAEQKADALLGGFSGAQDALRADIDAYNTALAELGGDVEGAKEAAGIITELNTSFENNNEEVNKAIEAKNALNEVLGITSENEATLSTAVNDSTIYIGANTKAWLINAIAQSDAFKALSKNVEAMESISNSSFDMNDALEAAGNGTLDQYFQGVQVEAIQTAGWFEKLIYGAGNLGGVVGFLTKDMGFLGSIFTWVANAAGDLISFLGRAAGEVARFFGIELFPTSIALEDLQTATQGAFNQFQLLGPAAAAADEAIAKAGDSAEGASGNVDDLGKSMRTVVDYANDLRSVFSRAFEIRFGQQQSLDEIASGWNNIAEKAASAAKEIRDANASIAELSADKSILEYQLSVAERYGDEQRAAVIRAKIAKVDENIADKKQDISDATIQLTRSTKGNTDTAIENRNAILGQLGSYTDLVEMYAKTGLKGEDLEAKVRELKEEFIQQAIQAGYSREELEPYVETFEDLTEAIQLTPRNVDIEFNSNVSAARQAVNEYLAQIQQANRTVTTTFNAVVNNNDRIKAAIDEISALREEKRMTQRSGRSTASLDRAIEEAISRYRSIPGYASYVYGMANGGLVTGKGTATSDSIPAMLSNGEFVVKASAVGAYGVDFMNALNQQKVGSFNSSVSSAPAGSGSNITHLSPEDRALLRAALDRPVNLYTDSGKIASSANAGNVLFAQRGSR